MQSVGGESIANDPQCT